MRLKNVIRNLMAGFVVGTLIQGCSSVSDGMVVSLDGVAPPPAADLVTSDSSENKSLLGMPVGTSKTIDQTIIIGWAALGLEGKEIQLNVESDTKLKIHYTLYDKNSIWGDVQETHVFVQKDDGIYLAQSIVDIVWQDNGKHVVNTWTYTPAFLILSNLSSPTPTTSTTAQVAIAFSGEPFVFYQFLGETKAATFSFPPPTTPVDMSVKITETENLGTYYIEVLDWINDLNIIALEPVGLYAKMDALSLLAYGIIYSPESGIIGFGLSL